MEILDIPQLQPLLDEVLDKDETCEGVEISRLTSPGENFGSLMLSVKITVRNGNGEEKSIPLVAKLVPPTEFSKNLMNIPFTFRNEFAFYKNIVPCLKQFQKEQGSSKSLGIFTKYLGGRLNLHDNSEVVDDNGVILLENLKEEGYTLLDRRTGFDLEASKLVLKKLAEFHGVALAIKILRPKLFDEILQPYFEEFFIFTDLHTDKTLLNETLTLIKDDELCNLFLTKIKDVIDSTIENMKLPKNSPKHRLGLFTTLIHGDLWTNNIMVKKTYSNKITEVKFVDWQLYEHSSITKDVVFFCFTSVELSTLKNSFDELLRFYFQNLISNLEDLNCNTSELSFEAFKQEMKQSLQEMEYFRILGVLFPILSSDNDTMDVEEINGMEKLSQLMKSLQICKDRASVITRELIQRGWI